MKGHAIQTTRVSGQIVQFLTAHDVPNVQSSRQSLLTAAATKLAVEIPAALPQAAVRPVLTSKKGLFVALCIGIIASKLPHIPRFLASSDPCCWIINVYNRDANSNK